MVNQAALTTSKPGNFLGISWSNLLAAQTLGILLIVVMLLILLLRTPQSTTENVLPPTDITSSSPRTPIGSVCDMDPVDTTKLHIYSWHIHHTWTDVVEHASQAFEYSTAFHTALMSTFASEGQNGRKITSCAFGPNNIGVGTDYICIILPPGQSINVTTAAPKCGTNGKAFPAPSPSVTPWALANVEIFIPKRLIVKVSSFIEGWLLKQQGGYNDPATAALYGLSIMRHPNTGCNEGDHTARHYFFTEKQAKWSPELCTWGLGCNTPGYGCEETDTAPICGGDTGGCYASGSHSCAQYRERCYLQV